MLLLEKLRGDRRGWRKVSDLRAGMEIAVPSESGGVLWDEIASITPAGRERVYDIEVEGTHNFIGNDIFAHNTYVLRAHTALAADGSVYAGGFIAPVASPAASSTVMAEIPPDVLTADRTGVDLYKLTTYNFSMAENLAAAVAADEANMVSLETRVEKLESGQIATASGSPVTLSTSTLMDALSNFGVLIRKGIAQFNTLVFQRLVAATDSTGASSAGSVTLLTGNTVAQVKNSLVAPSTKVFITFNSQITGSWWVSDKTSGSFHVVLSASQENDVSFDYFLVQTEGQVATSTPDSLLGSSTSKSNLEVELPSSGTDHTPPVITLIGDNPLRISVGGAFVDPGVQVTDDSGAALPVIVYVNGIEQASEDAVDTSVEATYVITYVAIDAAGNNTTARRAVIVGNPDGAADASSFMNPPASGSDGTSPDTATSLTPTVNDAAPSVASDVEPPVVTLKGDAAMQITVGDAFTDPGATAMDDTDGDLTAKIVVAIADSSGSRTSLGSPTSTAGLYTLTYTATDAAGNVGSVSRVVTVRAPIAPAATSSPL